MKQVADSGPRATVYVVDADPAVRDGLHTLFTGLGLDVELYPNAEAFLDAPVVSGPHCLVAEVHLPGLNGVELLDELRRRGRATPAVLLSSDGDLALAVRALRAGALDVLDKPFVAAALADRVRQALRALCGG